MIQDAALSTNLKRAQGQPVCRSPSWLTFLGLFAKRDSGSAFKGHEFAPGWAVYAGNQVPFYFPPNHCTIQVEHCTVLNGKMKLLLP